MVTEIRVEGLRELRGTLRRVDTGLAKELGQAGKKAAEMVVATARPKVPVRTGRARRSLRATASRGGSVVGGGSKAPYFGWLDFGGRVGRNKTVSRPVITGGRIIYPALAERRNDVIDEFVQQVDDLVRKAGLK